MREHTNDILVNEHEFNFVMRAIRIFFIYKQCIDRSYI